MFTKYTDINLPKNYSGSRFKEALSDTKMKTHRATEIKPVISNVKTSVSPSFQDMLDKTVSEAQDNTITDMGEPVQETYFKQEADHTSTQDDMPETRNELAPYTEQEKKDTHESELSRLLKSSGIGKLLDSVSRDDLLLIGLIILLAGDSSTDSLDAIIILALLLLYH